VADRPAAWRRALAPVLSSKAGSWFYLNLAPAIDKRLLPATGGRISVSVGAPVLCLEVAGAKSGVVRRTPLLFVRDGQQLALVASATGRPRHPAWYYNVLAADKFTVWAPGGRSGSYKARVAEQEERARLWEKARLVYPGFEIYEQRARDSREIPIVVLTRA
jgi:F420H(2)-dependent quinone reductase